MIKKHINEICFIFLNVLVVFIFFPWLQGHYATDTYNIMNVGYEYYSIHNSLVDGRIFMFLIMQLAAILKIGPQLLGSILLFLALIISNISVIIVKNIVYNNLENKNVKNEIFSYIIAYTFIYNFMYIENLYFFECLVMAISILLNLIAAKIFADKGSKYLPKVLLITLVSMFCYQGTISSFIAFVILFESLNRLPLKNFLKNITISLFVVGIVSVFNLVFVKTMSNVLEIQQIRLNNNILYNIAYIIKNKLNTLIFTSDNFYNGMFLVLSIILGSCFIDSFKFKENKEKYIIFFGFIFLGSIFCVEIPYILSISAFFSGRTRFAVGALCSASCIFLFSSLKEICEERKERVNKLLYIFISFYFVLNIANYIEIVYNVKMINEYEKEYVAEIEKDINEYEEKNGINIKNVRLIYDKNADNLFRPNNTRKNIMTCNAALCSWSAIGTLNFYTNRNLELESDNVYLMKVDENWFICDDVLYIKIAQF